MAVQGLLGAAGGNISTNGTNARIVGGFHGVGVDFVPCILAYAVVHRFMMVAASSRMLTLDCIMKAVKNQNLKGSLECAMAVLQTLERNIPRLQQRKPSPIHSL